MRVRWDDDDPSLDIIQLVETYISASEMNAAGTLSPLHVAMISCMPKRLAWLFHEDFFDEEWPELENLNDREDPDAENDAYVCGVRFFVHDSGRYPNYLIDDVNNGLSPMSGDRLEMRSMGGWDCELAISKKHTSFVDIEHAMLFAYQMRGGSIRNFDEAYKTLFAGGMHLVDEEEAPGAKCFADVAGCISGSFLSTERWQEDYPMLRQRHHSILFQFYGTDIDDSSLLEGLGALMGDPDRDARADAHDERCVALWRARMAARDTAAMDESM
jgi:hypothetical protein